MSSRVSAIAAAILLAGGASAQELDLDDLENRADYAYFTGDAKSLRTLIRETESARAKASAGKMAHYVLGFAQYRLGSLLAKSQTSDAVRAMGACVDELDEALEEDEEFAEALALQSACHGQLAALRTLSAVVSGPKAGARIEKALELAPRNPRVVLLDALNDYERPKAFGGDKARALVKLRTASELFDKADEDAASLPGWGHADALAALGRSLFEAGDLLGARNALERSLLIAPEYAGAKELLARVTATR
jgi:hypothetical protein